MVHMVTAAKMECLDFVKGLDTDSDKLYEK